MKVAMQLILKGRVQGVGYRWFARENAERLSIVGHVKNLMDGEVEVVAQGEEEQVEAYIRLLKQGPAFSRVLDVDIRKLEVQDSLDRFQVVF